MSYFFSLKKNIWFSPEKIISFLFINQNNQGTKIFKKTIMSVLILFYRWVAGFSHHNLSSESITIKLKYNKQRLTKNSVTNNKSNPIQSLQWTISGNNIQRSSHHSQHQPENAQQSAHAGGHSWLSILITWLTAAETISLCTPQAPTKVAAVQFAQTGTRPPAISEQRLITLINNVGPTPTLAKFIAKPRTFMNYPQFSPKEKTCGKYAGSPPRKSGSFLGLQPGCRRDLG